MKKKSVLLYTNKIPETDVIRIYSLIRPCNIFVILHDSMSVTLYPAAAFFVRWNSPT